MSKLTKADYETIDACQSRDAWKDACDTIKGRHGGQYPFDWHAVVLKGGLGNRILSRWGMDMEFRMTTIRPGDSLADARKRTEFPAHPLVQCKGCDKFPDQLAEYVEMAEVEPEVYKTPTDAAKSDGTYNKLTGKFHCTACYLKKGMPTGRA